MSVTDSLKVMMLVKSQAEAFKKPTAAKRLRAKAKQHGKMKKMAKGKSSWKVQHFVVYVYNWFMLK